jgi:hypothetical protein
LAVLARAHARHEKLRESRGNFGGRAVLTARARRYSPRAPRRGRGEDANAGARVARLEPGRKPHPSPARGNRRRAGCSPQARTQARCRGRASATWHERCNYNAQARKPYRARDARPVPDPTWHGRRNVRARVASPMPAPRWHGRCNVRAVRGRTRARLSWARRARGRGSGGAPGTGSGGGPEVAPQDARVCAVLAPSKKQSTARVRPNRARAGAMSPRTCACGVPCGCACGVPGGQREVWHPSRTLADQRLSTRGVPRCAASYRAGACGSPIARAWAYSPRTRARGIDTPGWGEPRAADLSTPLRIFLPKSARPPEVHERRHFRPPAGAPEAAACERRHGGPAVIPEGHRK